jgi:hypothetical protein
VTGWLKRRVFYEAASACNVVGGCRRESDSPPSRLGCRRACAWCGRGVPKGATHAHSPARLLPRTARGQAPRLLGNPSRDTRWKEVAARTSKQPRSSSSAVCACSAAGDVRRTAVCALPAPRPASRPGTSACSRALTRDGPTLPDNPTHAAACTRAVRHAMGPVHLSRARLMRPHCAPQPSPVLVAARVAGGPLRTLP